MTVLLDAHHRRLSWLACGRHRLAVAVACSLMIAAGDALADDAKLVEAKLGISTLSASDRATLWRRVDEWATADSLLDFCGTKMNIYRRGWVAVSPCIETPSLKKVGTIFRAKKASYLKILETTYPDAEKKKAFCDNLGSRLKDYQRIINAQIAEAKGMCDACLWC